MWYKIQGEKVQINILAKPHAKKSAILGIRNQELQVSIHAKPHEGEANKELISSLASFFKVPKSQIILQRGEGSRHKQVVLPLTDSVKALLSKLNDASF